MILRVNALKVAVHGRLPWLIGLFFVFFACLPGLALMVSVAKPGGRLVAVATTGLSFFW